MKRVCASVFEESLLSGFVDNELTQADRQRVRLHVEKCAECQREVEVMRSIRRATMSTSFREPSDEEWNEAPRSRSSLWLRRLGWVLMSLWLILVTLMAIGSIAAGLDSWLEIAVMTGGSLGILLLFVSVVMDRLKALPGDRYRRVQK